MTIYTLIADNQWIPPIIIVIFFALLAGYSILKGKKGEIPIDFENPLEDKRRHDVGSTDSRIIPRN